MSDGKKMFIDKINELRAKYESKGDDISVNQSLLDSLLKEFEEDFNIWSESDDNEDLDTAADKIIKILESELTKNKS